MEFYVKQMPLDFKLAMNWGSHFVKYLNIINNQAIIKFIFWDFMRKSLRVKQCGASLLRLKALQEIFGCVTFPKMRSE